MKQAPEDTISSSACSFYIPDFYRVTSTVNSQTPVPRLPYKTFFLTNERGILLFVAKET